MVQGLQQAVSKLEARLSALEKSSPTHRAAAPQTQVRALLGLFGEGVGGVPVPLPATAS